MRPISGRTRTAPAAAGTCSAAGDLLEAVRVLAAFVARFLFPLAIGQNVLAGGEIFRDVVLTDYSELASSPELARRMLSPLAGAQLEREIARSGKKMMDQSIKLPDERFIIYVPSASPARGFALLIFVPPWQDARLPPGWATALERHGVIFVSAARSGNEENALDRREPLALLAAQNMIRRYPVDPERVYVAGFSGGSRVALRLALGYPDVFRGVILDAGSDPIGSAQIPIPPKDLFFQFQSLTRLVYLTGARDDLNINDDSASMLSLRKWCVFGLAGYAEPNAGHEVAGSGAFSWALDALLRDARPDTKRLAACRSAIDEQLKGKMQQVESLVQGGHQDDAQKLLTKLDAQYGGLAAPRSVELAPSD